MSHSTLWTKNFLLALLANMMVNLSYNMMNSTIGIYAKGFTNVEMLIGLCASGFTGAALVTKLGSAKLLDLFPAKKVAILSLIGSILTSIGYLFVHEIHLIILIRVLHGLAFGLGSVAVTTIVTSSIPRIHLLEGVGYNMMLVTLTTAIGPGIVLTITNSQPERFVFAFLILIAVLASALLCITPLNNSSKELSDTDCVGRLDVTLATWFPALLAVLVAGAQSGVVVYLNLYAMERGFGNMTPYFLCFALANFSIRFSMTKITAHISERTLLYFSGVASIAVMLTIYFTTTPYLIFLAGILFGTAMGFFYPIASTMVIKSISWRKQNVANTINAATGDCANLLGVTLWSILATHTGTYSVIYPVAAGTMMLYLILLTIYPAILKQLNIPEESECSNMPIGNPRLVYWNCVTKQPMLPIIP